MLENLGFGPSRRGLLTSIAAGSALAVGAAPAATAEAAWATAEDAQAALVAQVRAALKAAKGPSWFCWARAPAQCRASCVA